MGGGTRRTRAASTPRVSRAMYSNDRLSSASPARMAMSSPNCCKHPGPAQITYTLDQFGAGGRLMTLYCDEVGCIGLHVEARHETRWR